jgi:uncharacterized protein
MVVRRILPVHPLPMRTTFRQCFLVNFAVLPDALAGLLPAHLKPDIYEGRAYVSVVIAEMSRMRPALFPAAFGFTYNQVVYRAVVRCGAERGVTFLRSDADSRLMVVAGNALTFFRFHHADISWRASEGGLAFSLSPRGAVPGSIRADYDLVGATHRLPSTSAFRDLSTAQQFLTELYAAFGTQRAGGRVEVVRIVRTPWESAVVSDRSAVYEAMSSGLLFRREEATLDAVFYVRALAYHWRRLAAEAIAG